MSLTAEQIIEKTGLDFGPSFFSAHAWWIAKDPNMTKAARAKATEHNLRAKARHEEICKQLDCDPDKAIRAGRDGVFHLRGFFPNDWSNVDSALKKPGPYDPFDKGDCFVLDGRTKVGRKLKKELGHIDASTVRESYFMEGFPKQLLVTTERGNLYCRPSAFCGTDDDRLSILVTTFSPEELLEGSNEFEPDPELWERRPLGELMSAVEHCTVARSRKVAD